jgi:type I restriction enzyme M protein
MKERNSMLDTDTKRRIDTARDILVGKVPDPKSQVEQITIALIYKFMDDMDAESEELGGKRKFFTGDFARYGWARLMDRSLGGHEMLGLYSEGIARMPENPGIPALFRDIFKNAYLPYRDPETLKAFLKIIDEFSYDHSERLGDAFEYLLSVLGSQGDAGQFRTPRHIIDFMVEVLAPQKNETILDPACGTAGFLISAYKHILRANTDANGQSTLTPDEKGRLARNFKGYDISPDMVRLSLVNLYLHGFTDPHIFEYDTLTSEEHWNEFADVILANPPFMSPKGGIKPHKRFTIQAKRSEVLFVDYMAEHLTPTGRAAIIVPEGIIFQSQTAYKELRKMLVENSLVAVVSLPAGCFNPYSGVKTSILILDKSLARQSDTIAFFKVENDGFGLGAQRRAIEKNDLPQVKAELADYLHALRSGSSDRRDGSDWRDQSDLSDRTDQLNGSVGSVGSDRSVQLIVPKEKIAANGDYNLSGERYREGVVGQNRVPMVPLGDVAELIRGITFGKSQQLANATDESLLIATTKAAQSSGLVETDLYHVPRNVLKDDSKLLRSGDILISTANSLNLLGRTTHIVKIERPMSFGAFMSLIRPNNEKILDGYLIHCLRTTYAADFFVRNANTTTNISNLNLSSLAVFQIPLPPLEVQKEVVAEIEDYQKVINGARAVLDHYRPHISLHPDWPMVPLSEIIKLSSGRGLTQSNMREGSYPVYGGNGKTGMHSEYFQELPNIVIGRVGAYCGAVHITEPKAWITDNALFITEFKQEIDLIYLAQVLMQLNLNQFAKVGGQPSISQTTVCERSIPLPPLATQQAIVAEIEAEQALVAANRELITRFEKKIQTTLARIWGEETSDSSA